MTIKWLLIFLLCGSAVTQASTREHWLWPKAPVKNFDRAENTLYILRGQIKIYRGKEIFEQQAPNFAKLQAAAVLVYRLRYLPTPDFAARIFLQDIRAWRAQGISVVGLQLDYDSPSRKLPLYQRFIRDLQSSLGADIPISITGLVDWLRSSPTAELAALQRHVQFIAFQLYTHGKVYSDIDSRIQDLKKLKHPFKVGVLDVVSIAKAEAQLKPPLYQGPILFQETPRP